MDNYLIFNALYNNNYQDVIYILNNYVNPNCQNEYGYTPLMVACINGNIQIVDVLLMYDVNLNIRNNKGQSALMIAIYNGHVDIMMRLINNNINLDIIDNHNNKAVDYYNKSNNVIIKNTIVIPFMNQNIISYVDKNNAYFN